MLPLSSVLLPNDSSRLYWNGSQRLFSLMVGKHLDLHKFSQKKGSDKQPHHQAFYPYLPSLLSFVTCSPNTSNVKNDSPPI
jgi:hypothetical protein